MHMDQKIFTMGLSDGAITLYLLLTGLADAGRDLFDETISGMWNDTPEALEGARVELTQRGIIEKEQKSGLTLLCPLQMWRN
ncbi:MAG: hypothetical protein MI742_04875 [Desulfobacterales bacterium]|nr:hypothetical protein [Desulfobacterales bacterium]